MRMEAETITTENKLSENSDHKKTSLHIGREALKFSASSFVSTIVDYILYAVIYMTTSGLVLANVCARIVSATLNYTINRKITFKSNVNVVKSAIQFYTLAAAVLAGNTIVLELLVRFAGINPYIAKVIAGLIFFVVNFLVQRTFIFKDRK